MVANNHQIYTLDLHFLGNERVIAAFLLRSGDDLALVECGPHATFERLEAGIRSLGFRIAQIKHVFLSHIHFDHAGAAWALAEQGATIYVHPVGAPHLISPEKLVQSATRIYGDRMNELWGEMRPIPAKKIQVAEHGQSFIWGNSMIRAWHTPGHAKHHIAWQIGHDLFCGDVAGVKIGEGPAMPPCPPPDIDIEAWGQSVAFINSQSDVNRLWLTHFGELSTKPSEHLQELLTHLDAWAQWIKEALEKGLSSEDMLPGFVAFVQQQLIQHGLNKSQIKQYESANPSYMSVNGLIRYWKKRGL